MQIEDIVALMKQMNQSGLSVLEYEADGTRLRLERLVAAPPVQEGRPETSLLSAPAGRPDHSPVASAEDDGIIKAPVVGVFFAAPSPDSDPFVQVGSKVEAGTTLCIIEAMKLMNEVTSTRAGQVEEILVTNGQRVEYGQPLMRIGGF